MLHRRAGFGATWSRLQTDLDDGPEKSVARLLRSDLPETEDSGFEKTSRILLKAALDSGQIERLGAWWIWRMYFGHQPFQEKCVLMWHNHFATSNRTLLNPFRMYRQNRIFREHGMGRFRELLIKTVKDPAMLIWLNANDNRREHPNENLGRELLELFSLGIGNYTENDVKEAARALAGWSASRSVSPPDDPFATDDDDTLVIRNHYQDKFHKTILGKTGDWDGNDLLDIVLEHPATAKRLAWRICDELFGESVVSEGALDELATGLKENELNLEWAYKKVLNSHLFFANKNLKSRIAPPETFVLGSLIAMETRKCPASTLALANVFSALGRSLFQPPNVGGWDGGRTWLNGRTLVARSNFVHSLIQDGLNRFSKPPNLAAIVNTFEAPTDSDKVVQLGELLLGLDKNSESDREMLSAVAAEGMRFSSDSRWPMVATLLLNSASAHLC